MKIIGIDLSGPSNVKDTSVVCFQERADKLLLLNSLFGANDQQIFETVSLFVKDDQVIVGLDAPLSYNIGGGDRPADAELRKRIIPMGLRSGSVMPPTMQRMAYLTLRGISLSRCLETLRPHYDLQIIEVHPGGTLALRQAPIDEVLQFKNNAEAQVRLLRWLEEQGLENISKTSVCSDHYVAACAGALATWKWYHNKAIWHVPAKPPYHPYDFAC
jgi:predicted nuclease with RNAse H fold